MTESKSVISAQQSRPDKDQGAVLITGICGRLGKLVARQIHRELPVIGIDRRDFHGKPKDIVHYQVDVRRKKTRDILRTNKIQAVIHLGVMHDLRKSQGDHHSWNVLAFAKLLEYIALYKIPKLIVLSSADAYGPSAENPQFLTEEAPLMGAAQFHEIRDLVEVDMLAQSFFWKHPEIETVILRPCHILGGVRNAASNYLRLPHAVTLLGFDPMVQVIHERDVAHAIALASRKGVRGIFNLRGPGEIPLSRVFALLGKRPLSVPAPLIRMALRQLWAYRLADFPEPELDHIRYICMVDGERAQRELGFTPQFGLEATVRSVLDA